MKIPRHNDLENDRNLTRKHVAERNRRARINYYLEEIEKLITPSLSQITANAKLEKAEVLERTVEYIKQNRSSELDIQQNYVRGFLECIRSIQAFLVTMKVSESDVRHIFHGCLSSVRNRLQKSGLENQASSDINIMAINNLNRLRNMETQRTRHSNKSRTTKANVFKCSDSDENITTETTENTISYQGQRSSNNILANSCSAIHTGHEVDKLITIQTNQDPVGKTSKRAFGVLEEVVSNKQENNCSRNVTLFKDEKTSSVDMLKKSEKNTDVSDRESQDGFIQQNEENVNPDINYDDPMWRPW